MVNSRHESKVFDSIIEFISVYMMDMLLCLQRTIYICLHNVSVFKFSSGFSKTKTPIPFLCYCSTFILSNPISIICSRKINIRAFFRTRFSIQPCANTFKTFLYNYLITYFAFYYHSDIVSDEHTVCNT